MPPLTQRWSEFIDGFEAAQPILEACLKSGQLAYVYTNGFVLPNKPTNGGIFSNDTAEHYDTWLRDNLGAAPIAHLLERDPTDS